MKKQISVNNSWQKETRFKISRKITEQWKQNEHEKEN